MTLAFVQAAVLFGLAGLAIPVLVHLWNRRRAPVVEWGAMQFLQLQPAQKRRLLLEDFLLLLLRLVVVAFIVLALAGPIARGPAVAAWTRPPRDIVFIVDATARMNRRDLTPNPWNLTFERLADEVNRLGPKDRWSLVAAGRPLETPLDGFRPAHETFDWQSLPKDLIPSSRPNVAAAIARAWTLLDEQGKSPQREIVVLSDGLRDGWTASPEWERLASRWATLDPTKSTTLRHQAVGGDLNPRPVNYRLTVLTAPLATVNLGRRIRFEVRVSADIPSPPPAKVRLIIEDQLIREAGVPPSWDAAVGQGDVSFDHVFRKAGPHHVRFELEYGPPLDAFPDDDRRDTIVDVVPEYSVLIIDGAETLTSESPAFFLMNAFADAANKKQTSPIAPRRIADAQFRQEDLSTAKPCVVILADVPALSAAQGAMLDRFVRDGGAVLVLLGPRARPDSYADFQIRGEIGWLPYRMTQIAAAPAAVGLEDAALPSPALAVFRSKEQSGLANLRFTRWWRGTPDADAAIQAKFAGGDPWLISKSVGKGNVLVSTIPFDRSWDNNLAGSWEFPVLAHELIFALAPSATPYNLAPGEPIRLSPAMFEPWLTAPTLPLAGALERPNGQTKPVVISTWPGTVDAPGPSGVYRLRVDDRHALPFVVSDGDSIIDSAPLSADDKRRLSDVVPIVWDGDALAAPAAHGQAEIGRWLLLGLLAFLCLESWLARRMAGSA